MTYNIPCSLFTLLMICLFNKVISQVDFNNYVTLMSQGEMPTDFSSFTYKKVEENVNGDAHEMGTTQKQKFYTNIHYSVDDILHSGKVVYGDAISSFVSDIARKLLADEPSIFASLRFYVIKSNECNAFSTDQGIIFVTTGLIAQMENEAQLAFVLAHEISHYAKHHVVNTFIYQSKARLNIQQLSTYSKENEFEADIYGIQWYNKAGYSREQLYSAFDILMYSYLPFDEIKFPVTYFNTPKMYIPESMFTKEIFEITAKEDYDDSRSSHPNIKKRKESIELVANNISDWGDKTFLLDENTFSTIRNICRFEWVREDVMRGQYVEALYAIFILENDFPNSLFLKRMKAQTWYGFALQLLVKQQYDIPSQKLKYEGEIANLNDFIKKLTPEALQTIALRQVYDLNEQSGKDPQINLIYRYLVKNLACSRTFKIGSYKSTNYLQHQLDLQKEKNQDTITVANKTKYEKIHSQKQIFEDENQSAYYLYGIPDLITDSVFLTLYKTYQLDSANNGEHKKGELVDLIHLNIKERRAYLKELYKTQNTLTNVDSLIVVEPIIYSKSFGKIKPVRTEKLQYIFSNAIAESGEDADMTMTFIDRNHMDSKSTKEFNSRSILYGSLSQMYRESNLDIVPVDYELIKELKNQYNSSRVSFLWVDHLYMSEDFGENIFRVWVGICCPLAAPFIYLSAHKMQITMLIFNIDKCDVESIQIYYLKDIPKKRQLTAIMYNILSAMKQKTT